MKMMQLVERHDDVLLERHNMLVARHDMLVHRLNLLKPTVRRAHDALLAKQCGGSHAGRGKIIGKYTDEQLRDILQGYIQMERELLLLRSIIITRQPRRRRRGRLLPS